MSLVTMKEIRDAAEEYAEAVRAVRNLKEAMGDELRVVERKYTQPLIEASVAAGEAEQMVMTLLNSEGAAGLFIKPKTVAISGVSVGFRKKVGTIVITNEDNTVDLIYKQLPAKAGMLLNVTTSVSKKALDTLTAEELKKIGVIITGDIDEPVVKVADGEIQKLINACIKQAMERAS